MLSFTHNGMLRHSVFIQKSDKDGRKLMVLQAMWNKLEKAGITEEGLQFRDLVKQGDMKDLQYAMQQSGGRGGRGRGGARGGRGGQGRESRGNRGGRGGRRY